MSLATEEVKSEIIVTPFGIEIDHPRNDDVLMQSIVGLRLRSAIDGSKGHVRADGEYVVPKDQAMALGAFPKTPGMQLHVDPRSLAYVVVDPLADDDQLVSRIESFIKRNGGSSATKVKGIETQKGELDVHRMKTLVREMMYLVNAKEARVIKGSAPSQDEIESLPGEFLLNPGSQVQNTQPMFEKDWSGWINNLKRSDQ